MLGSVWGLGSQLCVGIYHQGIACYSQLVLFPESRCQTIQIRHCPRYLWATLPLRVHSIILSLEVNIWHGCVQVLLLERRTDVI